MTAQILELLIFEGRPMQMAKFPELPTGHPGLIDLLDEGSWRDTENGIYTSTACSRSYLGTWVIEGGRLLLFSVRGRYRVAKGAMIFAEWFSGRIVAPIGGVVMYVHMGFESKYEQELHIDLERGRVTGVHWIENRRK